MIPATFWKPIGAAFNPATLALTSWLKAPYAGAPWAAASSAGTSSTNTYTTSGADPTVGASLNGKATAAFASQFLSSTLTSGSMYSASAGSAAFLFNASSLPANTGAVYEDGNFLTDTNAEVAFGVSSSGLRFTLQGTGFASFSLTGAIPTTSAWHLAQFKWDGTNIKCRLDSGTWSALACTGWVTAANMISTLGRGYSGAQLFAGLMAEAMTAAVTISDADFDNIKSYCNSVYGLSL